MGDGWGMLLGMRTSLKFALITLAAGVPAFLLTPVLFPPNPSIAPPDAGLIPYFLVLGVIESLFFGIGVAFLILGLPMMRRVASVSGVSPWPAYLAIGYLTASWWPHLGMHGEIRVPLAIPRLLVCEPGVHHALALGVGLDLAERQRAK